MNSLSKLYSKVPSKDSMELAVLCHSILVSAQTAVPFKSWTTRMLSLGVYVILKKISEETAEFTIAVSWDRPSGVREECADLIYHILLLFVGLQIRYERLLEALPTKLTQPSSATSLICLESIAFEIYNDRKFETSTAFIIRKLYSSVASLTVLCLKINTTTEVNERPIANAASEVFVNIIMLLYSRGVRYQDVANVLISRCQH
ncbi:MAG: phosphoribosyl-ATP diphosphatase [Candidatus Hodgkinia cicadicola]